MSLMPTLDEFTLKQLRAEVAEREKRAAAGVCTFCLKDRKSWSRPCKFPRRHDGRED